MVSQLELRIEFFNPMIAELVILDILMLMSMIEGVPSLALVIIWYCDVSLFHFFNQAKRLFIHPGLTSKMVTHHKLLRDLGFIIENWGLINIIKHH